MVWVLPAAVRHRVGHEQVATLASFIIVEELENF